MSEHPAVVLLVEELAQAEEAARAADGVGIHLEATGAYEHYLDAGSPEAVLRRVTADRRILDLHQRVECGEFGCDCHQCCSVCRWTEHDEAGHEPAWGEVTRHVYPCRTVLLLAQAWGWTKEETR